MNDFNKSFDRVIGHEGGFQIRDLIKEIGLVERSE